jgi:predicted TIM-barrel fold metal-dependent hydrolase
MSRYDGPVVDVDVHHRPKSDAEVVAYLPKRWQEYVNANPRMAFPLYPPPPTGGSVLGGGFGMQADLIPPDGSAPGSDYRFMCEQLLDPGNYHKAVLTFYNGDWGGHLNTYFTRELHRAFNSWNLDTWLSIDDDRLMSVVALPSAEPEEAAKEIRRVGGHPKIVSALIGTNALGRPLGDPAYHPIYQAASEMGLSVAVHPSVIARPGPMMLGVGGGKTMAEDVNGFAQQGMHYLTSLIVNGVFEKYSNLHFVIKEFGFTWVPGVMWKLDEHYDLLRLESPWIKRLPSEYIREHVRFSTQPIEESADRPDAMAELLRSFDGMEDLLVFSSDYPHPTMDEARFAERTLPAEWLPKVMCENACELYGWPIPRPVGAV